MMDKDKCPYCGAETRPGDNFCLNCGNRLLPATPSSQAQQAQPAMSDATLSAPDDWAAALSPSPSNAWPQEDAGATLAGASPDAQTYRSDSSAPTIASSEPIEQPARFILRSDNGEVLKEYPLDKHEITIGRAPNSGILLSKDKLTSRRHAVVLYENSQYLLRDERSANGTFVNGQQIEEMTPRLLQDGDHVGIGEHELIFRAFGSKNTPDVEELPTVAVPLNAPAELTYRTREDELATVATSDDFSTRPVDESPEVEVAAPPEPVPASSNGSSMPASAPSTPQPVPVATSFASAPASSAPGISASTPLPSPSSRAATSSGSLSGENMSVYNPPTSDKSDANVTFNRLSSLSQPNLPDMTPLMAALSALDGQVMSLQEQINATQEAMRNHEAEVAQTGNQLREGVRRVSERMDSTIADVARSREALAWAELLQLMEDVMNNPRDIEYVTKLARKARELNKVFQLHQNVLNTMAECNSLLRSMISEDR